MAEEGAAYLPQSRLSLWMLADPAAPRPVGEIVLADMGRAVGLRYGADWRVTGFALSEDLPLVDEFFLPPGGDGAAGALEDARPDRWGERVIRRFVRSPRLSILEMLLFAGDDRYGALGVSTQPDAYVPWRTGPMPHLGDLERMGEVVRKVLANEPVGEIEARLLRPGVSLGGARPKSLVAIDGEPWLVKFGEGEDEDTPLIEHATMTLARRCGIDTAATRALPLRHGHAVAVRRFDREAGGRRRHAMSAHVALRAASEELGYPQFAQLMRRLCRADAIAVQQAQLFRRMVFNILVDNTDDHEKNHALLRQADGSWTLAPAFDVVPSASGLSVQAMAVGSEGHVATLDNALTQCRAFGLRRPEARRIVQEICLAVNDWQAHFEAQGVSPRDRAMLAQYLDGERLGDQRRAFARAG